MKGTDLSIGLFELAGKQSGQRIVVDSSTTVGGPSWPNGCHICEVELDPATGEVEVVAYASVNDVGTVVNPMIVRGQLDGGAVQGLGQALIEQIAYDPETGQLLTGSLMDYALPRAVKAPPFVTEMDTSTPCLTNPLGVKGVGELGTIGATPSVVNAVGASGAVTAPVTLNHTDRMAIAPPSPAVNVNALEPLFPLAGVSVTWNRRELAVDEVGTTRMPAGGSSVELALLTLSVRPDPLESTSLTVTLTTAG